MAEPVRFTATIRHWDPVKGVGLAVIDIPDEVVMALGGRHQRRVTGSLNGAPFQGSTMLVKGGGFAVGASKATLASAGCGVGDEVVLELSAEP